ncbi:MAG: adenylosuccinate lyase [Deltaproteobacteria bacterium]|nr:adenylosuccinate lyase [Deltaproteobacteria bacterium]MBW2152900.1 adenylosuccinate lyase [Deltaproteobacteria bacterium]
MNLTTLSAISPIDGRYRKQVEPLANYFSEAALIKYRLFVEVEYFIALCELPLPQLASIDKTVYVELRALYKDFTFDAARKVKDIEKKINHDVKAVEYFMREKFDALALTPYKEFIHFGLTSQDINNTALPLSLKEAWNNTLNPLLKRVIDKLEAKASLWKAIPMLARTHGQPASPTSLGKEIYVFVERLKKQMDHLKHIPFSAKFGGATGNFNAHCVAYPEIDWIAFGDYFVNSVLGLERSKVTTQIEHYDNLAAFFDNLKRINTILIDFDRDIWSYISMDYFKQAIKKQEVGSSTMPHKVNPIDFENSEGNFGIANAIFEHLSAKLPISRLQRDLTDSTVTRNIGVSVAHMQIGLSSLSRGLDKLIINKEAIQADLENNWAVVAEGIQTILRREGYPEPYEALKQLTRSHEKIDQKTILNFISKLEIPEAVKEELRRITPTKYTGVYDF